jgi:type I site-specific restriction endonuclease
MATGSGKTFTAITFVYRLLKYTNARRILFLVDTRNLGEQAERDVQMWYDGFTSTRQCPGDNGRST